MARENREVWEKRIERWRESGLTAKEFAAEVGVNAGTLVHWKYRLAAERRRSAPNAAKVKSEAVAFLELKPTVSETSPPSSAADSVFELVFASGTVVRVPAQFDAATLRRLLDVMAVR